MKAREIPLVSPTGSSIAGFLTKSGSFFPDMSKFSRQNGEDLLFFEIPQGMMGEIADNDGDRVCVYQYGKHWSAADVMWEFTPRAPDNSVRDFRSFRSNLLCCTA